MIHHNDGGKVSPISRIHPLYFFAGNAGDSLSVHREQRFSTKDRDNDKGSGDCAKGHQGAWWYNACHASNLNGRYHNGNHTSYADGINWYHWKGHHYSAKQADMKIQPVEQN